MKRSEIKLLERAMRQRWDIKQEYKDAAVRRLMRIIANPSSSNREATAAIKALITAESQNQSDDNRDEQIDERRNRFLDIAKELGITTHIEQIPEAGSSGDNTSASEHVD